MAKLTPCTVRSTRLSYMPEGVGAPANADRGDVIELTDKQVDRYTKIRAVEVVEQDSDAVEPAAAPEPAEAETATTDETAGGDESTDGESDDDGPFDAGLFVAGANVREVVEYAKAHPEDVDDIVEAERAGQGRATILDLA